MYRRTMILALVSFLFITAFNLGDAKAFAPQVGENLEYEVIVKSMIHGANQSVKILSTQTLHSREVLNIQSTMKTIGTMDAIAKFSEKEDLVLDREGLFPWVIRREVHDKDETVIDEVTFDYVNNVAVRQLSRNGGQTVRSEIKFSGMVQDGLSLQFYLRKTKLTPGEAKVNFYSNGSIEETPYQVKLVKEKLKLDCGTYDGYYEVVHPRSSITILLADSDDQIPLVIRKNAKFGKIESKLTKIN